MVGLIATVKRDFITKDLNVEDYCEGRKCILVQLTMIHMIYGAQVVLTMKMMDVFTTEIAIIVKSVSKFDNSDLLVPLFKIREVMVQVKVPTAVTLTVAVMIIAMEVIVIMVIITQVVAVVFSLVMVYGGTKMAMRLMRIFHSDRSTVKMRRNVMIVLDTKIAGVER